MFYYPLAEAVANKVLVFHVVTTTGPIRT